MCIRDRLKPNELDPYKATTYGLGEIILKALDKGYREFIVGIGGSATNDAGAGLLGALGIRLLDKNGKDLPPGGMHLINLASIDVTNADPRLEETEVIIATDVINPLQGPNGATAVYGPQKGCLLYTSPSPRDLSTSRMPSSA